MLSFLYSRCALQWPHHSIAFHSAPNQSWLPMDHLHAFFVYDSSVPEYSCARLCWQVGSDASASAVAKYNEDGALIVGWHGRKHVVFLHVLDTCTLV